MWALGVTFYSFVYKIVPFFAETQLEIFDAIEN